MSVFEVVAFIKSIGAVLPKVITTVVTVLTAVIGVALTIPGDEPERTLQKVVDFLSKWSRK